MGDALSHPLLSSPATTQTWLLEGELKLVCTFSHHCVKSDMNETEQWINQNNTALSIHG